MEITENSPEENQEIIKSSNEILTELFNTFNAQPPVIVKKEKLDDKTDKEVTKSKHKKSKKKHKHKDKKHIKKEKDSSDSEKEKRKSKSKHKKRKRDLDYIKSEKDEISQKKIKVETTGSEKNQPDEAQNHNKIEDTSVNKEIWDENAPNAKQNSGKIQIKNLKHSTVYEATIREVEKEAIKRQEEELKKRSKYEDGELSDVSSNYRSDYDSKCQENTHRKEKKSSHKSKHKKSSRHSAKEDGSSRHRRSRSKSKKDIKDRSKEKKHKDEHKHNPFYRSEREDHFSKRKDDYYSDYSKLHYSRDSYRDRSRRDSRDLYRDDSRSRDRYRDRSPDDDYRNSAIDKKKLLEIARKNAINMLKSGSLPGALTLGPQAQEKVIAAIKAGGKTVEELTDFCKTLSRKEELGELSSISGSDGGESDSEKPFHHPFQIKEKPTSIVMNIKNAIPLPTKSLQEKTCELRMLFPVSSGQQHRKTENEWVPVSPKKAESATKTVASVTANTIPIATVPAMPLAIEPAPPPPSASLPLTLPVFPASEIDKNVDIGSIVSQRLTAMRKLQENPNDVQAISQIYKAQKEVF